MISQDTKQLTSGPRWLAYGVVALAALASTAALTAKAAPTALVASNESVWYAVRASGIVAYLLLAASTVWGVVLSSKIVKDWVPAAVALDLHNSLSWLAIGLSILHAGLLLASSYFDYSLINLLIPFTGPFKPFWVGLGIVGVYLLLGTSLTFYATKWIGYKVFRLIHLLTYVAFMVALSHSVVAGTDTAALAPVYIATMLVVLFVTAYRVLALRAGV